MDVFRRWLENAHVRAAKAAAAAQTPQVTPPSMVSQALLTFAPMLASVLPEANGEGKGVAVSENGNSSFVPDDGAVARSDRCTHCRRHGHIEADCKNEQWLPKSSVAVSASSLEQSEVDTSVQYFMHTGPSTMADGISELERDYWRKKAELQEAEAKAWKAKRAYAKATNAFYKELYGPLDI